jgi:branched-chain amino acid transport system substrate-binding protein
MPRTFVWINLAVLFLMGCSKSVSEPVWIGHLAPLSGPDKWQGERARQGVRLALEELKNDRELPGQSVVEVRHVDSGGDADRIQTEAVRLLTLNKVVALLDSSPAPLAERLAGAVRPYQVPLVTSAGLPASVGEDVFSLGVAPGSRGKVLARLGATDLKGKHAVVLSDARLASSEALARAFVREWQKNAQSTLENWAYRTDPELEELAVRAAKVKPDVLLFAGKVADLARARSSWETAGFHGPILFGGEDQGEGPLRPLVKPPDRVFLATVFAAEGLSEKGKAFARRYAERFHEPPDFFAAQAYDGTRLLAEALRRAGLPSQARLREELANVDSLEGVTGPLLFKDRRCRRRIFILALEKGTVQFVREFPGDD